MSSDHPAEEEPPGGEATWAERLARAVALRLTKDGPEEITLFAADAVSSQTMQVVYAKASDSILRGIRLGSADLRYASARIQASTIEELAFDLVVLGIGEPRPEEEFLPADADGIRWLPASRWTDI